MNKMKSLFVGFFLVYTLLYCACDTPQMREYYQNKENYITVTGTVDYISYNASGKSLYLGFSEDLDPPCDDFTFKIVGENLSTIQKNPNYANLQIGTKVQFVTAPKYWGDGFVMPIVSLSVDDEEWLSFDEGYYNFMTWFEETH